MADFYLSSGDRISVDTDVYRRIEGQKWERRGTSVQRRYWENGKTRVEILSNVVMGGKADRGHVWTHLDDDWRNFYRDNLVMRERGSHLVLPSEKDRQERARKAGKLGGKTRRPARNASGYAGVYTMGKKFKAMCTVDGKQKYLGLFATTEDAARAYDDALVGQGLPTVNFPKEKPSRAKAQEQREQDVKRAEMTELRRRVQQLETELKGIEVGAAEQP